MHYSEILNENVLEPTDYPLAEREVEDDGWKLSTYVVESSCRINGYKLCDLHADVVSPEGEVWEANLGPIYTDDGRSEAEAGIRKAKWVKAHWTEVMQSQC